jgi:hypothetical protein
MIGDTLTKENLTAIYEAMKKIKEVDRSEYFIQYFKEVESRLNIQLSIFSEEKEREYTGKSKPPPNRPIVNLSDALARYKKSIEQKKEE